MMGESCFSCKNANKVCGMCIGLRMGMVLCFIYLNERLFYETISQSNNFFITEQISQFEVLST